MVERGADVEALQSALRSIYGALPTGFMRDNTVYPLRMLLESPELFAQSHPGKTAGRRLVALFNPHDYHGRITSAANDSGDGDEGEGEEDEAEDVDDGSDEEAEMAFRIMDLNSDGELHSEEMLVYLSTAYRFLMKYESLRHGVEWTLTPEELAEATVLDCFNYSDRVLGDQLDFRSFYMWFLSGEENETRDVMVKGINLYEGAQGADVQQMVEEAVEVGPGGEQEARSGGDGDSQSSGPPGGFHISLKDAIEEMQLMTGINEQNVNDVMQLFQSNANEETGLINRKAFDSCFIYMHALREEAKRDASNERSVQEDLLNFLGQVFATLETFPGSGVADVRELCASVSVLCGGSAMEKIRAAFELCDTDGDGYISKEEFTIYLSAVFNFLFELSGEAFQLAGQMPNELAMATAAQAFPMDSDTEEGDEDLISFGEFKKWYTTGLGEFDVAEALLDEDSVSMDIDEMRRILGLTVYSSDYLAEFFRDISDEDGLLHKGSFFTGMERLVRRQMGRLTAPDRVHAEHMAAQIYELYDHDDRGYADYRDIVCGLLLLCGGSARDKASSAFLLFRGELSEAEGVSETEVAECFTSLLKLVADCNPSHLTDSTAEDLAAEVTVRIFSSAATRVSDLSPLSLAESDFISWFSLILIRLDGTQDNGDFEDDDSGNDLARANLSGHSEASTYSDMDYANDFDDKDDDEGADFNDHQSAESPLDQIAADMRSVRGKLGLSGVTADDLMEILSESDQQVLTSESWQYAVRMLVRLGGGNAQAMAEAQRVADVLFEAFETSQPKGYIDLAAFMAGMACLCDGPPEDRVMVAFTSLDVNCDGTISTGDLHLYFKNTLLVQVVCSPTMRNMFAELSCADMADAAVEACLLRVGARRGDVLSLDQVGAMVEHCQALALSGV